MYNHNPEINVLMPVYNGEKFLAEAIESVLRQTFTNFEFIIINDGSTDNTDNIIRSYKDERIRYYQNKNNHGIVYSLNKGISLAKAELIARMDADDICYADRLQKQYDFIINHPGGALYSCAVTEVNEQRQFIRKNDFHPDHFYYNLVFANWIYHSSMIYRKSCVEMIGKYADTDAEDWDMVWKLSRQYKIYHLPEILLEYRLSSNSLCRSTRKIECDNAILEQAERNIRYYMGKNMALDTDMLKVITNGEEAITKNHSIFFVLKCTQTLKRITKKILQTDNVNLNLPAITAAASKKREFLLAVSFSKLGILRGTVLFILSCEWKLLFDRVKSKTDFVIQAVRTRFYNNNLNRKNAAKTSAATKQSLVS